MKLDYQCNFRIALTSKRVFSIVLRYLHSTTLTLLLYLRFAYKLLSAVDKLQQLTVHIYQKTVFRFMSFICHHLLSI
jgi:hypothetical protein